MPRRPHAEHRPAIVGEQRRRMALIAVLRAFGDHHLPRGILRNVHHGKEIRRCRTRRLRTNQRPSVWRRHNPFRNFLSGQNAGEKLDLGDLPFEWAIPANRGIRETRAATFQLFRQIPRERRSTRNQPPVQIDAESVLSTRHGHMLPMSEGNAILCPQPTHADNLSVGTGVAERQRSDGISFRQSMQIPVGRLDDPVIGFVPLPHAFGLEPTGKGLLDSRRRVQLDALRAFAREDERAGFLCRHRPYRTTKRTQQEDSHFHLSTFQFTAACRPP